MMVNSLTLGMVTILNPNVSTLMTMHKLSPNTFKLFCVIHTLAWGAGQPMAFSQTADSSAKGSLAHYDAERFPGIPAERNAAAAKIMNYFPRTREKADEVRQKIAALADDDPLLADIYMSSIPDVRSHHVNLGESDMRRRSQVATAVFQERFKNPTSAFTRNEIVRWVTYNAWLDPEAFLPLIREWYHTELKTDSVTKNGYVISGRGNVLNFLADWGYPEDEAIFQELYRSTPDPWCPQKFQERLQRLKNGDSKSNPRLSADMPERGMPPAKNIPALPGSPATQASPTTTSSGVVIGLSAAALVSLLVLWFKRKKTM